MKWVTWERVGVDRMACAWLIRRFVDPHAEFLFISVGQSLPEGAEPFDIPGVRYSHRQGHCSFHTILKEFKINNLVLQRIARIVDEADTVQEVTLEPAAPGLDLICRGLSISSPDDAVALERGYLIFEGLYAKLAEEGQLV
ncbi:chromate resistance protein [Paenibacillus antri]|uniref:Chromate resistance protein n=1 Tax=Paenibacillus antri TaxID=2582848 RepID=A0A5R9FXP5_9BACL|nr:chromate resistance protein ChrB domain-containing protein [Paenibacillus antri]TLS48797.1 chromate resistance protein [Paenibacillus antri]